MKPQRIILVRHGQSEGNVDKEIYKTVPDYALRLTALGRKQALQAGKDIKKLIGDSSVQFYCSPFWRARDTYKEIAKSFPKHKYYEDPRLREQEWGHLIAPDYDRASEEQKRDEYGHFYYRLYSGESCADVYDRISDFLDTLHRDFEKIDFPETVILPNHGMTIRLFLMRWFHYSVEEFEMLANPKNGEFVVLEKQSDNHYKLVTPMRTHTLKHTFQYKWK